MKLRKTLSSRDETFLSSNQTLADSALLIMHLLGQGEMEMLKGAVEVEDDDGAYDHLVVKYKNNRTPQNWAVLIGATLMAVNKAHMTKPEAIEYLKSIV